MSAGPRVSVWDYPRPPALVPSERRVRVELGGVTIADSTRVLRVLETSHPPTIYVPPRDVALGYVRPGRGRSVCEWKGVARYHDLAVGDRRVEGAAWSYPDPVQAFAELRDHLCFYPSRVDACWLDDERVTAQPGDFYGGWITSELEGPFKGSPGTMGW